MLQSLTIENFKCFEHLELKDLGQFNLITGRNNVGKSSVLEAVGLSVPSVEQNIILIVNAQRIMPVDHYYQSFFRLGCNEHPTISVTGKHQGSQYALKTSILSIKQKKVERLKENLKVNSHDIESARKILKSDDFSEGPIEGLWFKREDKNKFLTDSFVFYTGPSRQTTDGQQQIESYLGMDPQAGKYSKFAAVTMSSKRSLQDFSQHAQNFNEIQKNGNIQDFCKFLSQFMKVDTFTDVRFIESFYYVKTKESERMIPLAYFGEGLSNLFVILSVLYGAAKNSLFLFDEIETGFHYSAQKIVWNAIIKIARERKLQIFATTHSMECVRAFSEVANEGEGFDARLINLRKPPGSHHIAKVHQKEQLAELLNAGLELT